MKRKLLRAYSKVSGEVMLLMFWIAALSFCWAIQLRELVYWVAHVFN